MLISLHVKNLALIEETEVFFTEGLNILTGETGAGKSIIIGSIGLALGAKADKDIVRNGAEYALIELVFATPRPEQIADIRAMELPIEDDGMLVLCRKITGGRSTLKINGETISAAQLRDLAGVLLDIHGQHEHQTLLKAANHREILDGFGREELSTLKSSLKEAYHEYQALCREIEKESLEESARKRELELLEFEIREIEEAHLTVGEDEQAEKEFQRMNNAGKIREALTNAHSLTGYEGEGSAGAGVSRALKEILAATRLDEGVEGLAEQLGDIDNLLNDFNRQLSVYLDSLEFDNARFLTLENRLNLLNHLKNKYRAGLAEIIGQGAEKKERAGVLGDYENYRLGLLQKQEGLRAKVLEHCRQISAIREALGKDLEEQMVVALRDLNFPHIRFETAIKADEAAVTAEGYDSVTFMIAPNLGEELRPLNQIASGGELSRIMLALKTVRAGQEEKETLIFDEIDAGISGKTAWKVAERLGLLARERQVICITHLPQIAAMSDAHFAITKKVEGERTVTGIGRLAEAESVSELARLLGAENVTEAGLANAKEMREAALRFKGK